MSVVCCWLWIFQFIKDSTVIDRQLNRFFVVVAFSLYFTCFFFFIFLLSKPLLISITFSTQSCCMCFSHFIRCHVNRRRSLKLQPNQNEERKKKMNKHFSFRSLDYIVWPRNDFIKYKICLVFFFLSFSLFENVSECMKHFQGSFKSYVSLLRFISFSRDFNSVFFFHFFLCPFPCLLMMMMVVVYSSWPTRCHEN